MLPVPRCFWKNPNSFDKLIPASLFTSRDLGTVNCPGRAVDLNPDGGTVSLPLFSHGKPVPSGLLFLDSAIVNVKWISPEAWLKIAIRPYIEFQFFGDGSPMQVQFLQGGSASGQIVSSSTSTSQYPLPAGLLENATDNPLEIRWRNDWWWPESGTAITPDNGPCMMQGVPYGTKGLQFLLAVPKAGTKENPLDLRYTFYYSPDLYASYGTLSISWSGEIAIGGLQILPELENTVMPTYADCIDFRNPGFAYSTNWALLPQASQTATPRVSYQENTGVTDERERSEVEYVRWSDSELAGVSGSPSSVPGMVWYSGRTKLVDKTGAVPSPSSRTRQGYAVKRLTSHMLDGLTSPGEIRSFGFLGPTGRLASEYSNDGAAIAAAVSGRTIFSSTPFKGYKPNIQAARITAEIPGIGAIPLWVSGSSNRFIIHGGSEPIAPDEQRGDTFVVSVPGPPGFNWSFAAVDGAWVSNVVNVISFAVDLPLVLGPSGAGGLAAVREASTQAAALQNARAAAGIDVTPAVTEGRFAVAKGWIPFLDYSAAFAVPGRTETGTNFDVFGPWTQTEQAKNCAYAGVKWKQNIDGSWSRLVMYAPILWTEVTVTGAADGLPLERSKTVLHSGLGQVNTYRPDAEGKIPEVGSSYELLQFGKPLKPATFEESATVGIGVQTTVKKKLIQAAPAPWSVTVSRSESPRKNYNQTSIFGSSTKYAELITNGALTDGKEDGQTGPDFFAYFRFEGPPPGSHVTRAAMRYRSAAYESTVRFAERIGPLPWNTDDIVLPTYRRDVSAEPSPWLAPSNIGNGYESKLSPISPVLGVRGEFSGLGGFEGWGQLRPLAIVYGDVPTTDLAMTMPLAAGLVGVQFLGDASIGEQISESPKESDSFSFQTSRPSYRGDFVIDLRNVIRRAVYHPEYSGTLLICFGRMHRGLFGEFAFCRGGSLGQGLTSDQPQLMTSWIEWQ